MLIGSIEEPFAHKYKFSVYWKELCKHKKNNDDTTIADRNETDINSYLTGLKNNCYKTVNGWWTYEFCFDKQLRQYHEEKTKDELTGVMKTDITVEYVLGKHNKDKEVVLFRTGKQSTNYLEETLDQGTECDITGEKRVTSVRYRCFPEKKSIQILTPIETSSCIYQIEVSVPELCNHPDFKTNDIPAYEILCYPQGAGFEPEQTEVEKPVKKKVNIAGCS
eukprot:UN26598